MVESIFSITVDQQMVSLRFEAYITKCLSGAVVSN